MKRPFEEITESTLRTLEIVKQNQLNNFQNFEKFMIWIVVFSIGGISLIASNISNLESKFSQCNIAILIFFLGFSSILGIIARFCFYKYQTFYQNTEIYIENAFRKNEMMQIDKVDIDKVNDINKLVFKLKDDFDLDYTYVLSTFNNYDLSNQQIIIENLKKNYKIYSEGVRKEYDFTNAYVREILKNAFGKSDKQIDKIINLNNSSNLNLYGYLTNFCSITSLLFFVISILLIIFTY